MRLPGYPASMSAADARSDRRVTEPGGLHYTLLGPVQAFRGGDVVAVPSGTQLAVLAGLLLSEGEITSGDGLAEFVWGDPGVQHPKSAVHTAVSRLRQLLGHDAIETFPGGYRLTVSGGEVDLLRFGRLVSRAERAEQSGSPESAAGLLAEAVGLWRWPVLANVYAAGGEQASSRLAERYLNVAEKWADLCLRAGQYLPVIERLQEIAPIWPYRERIAGQLMVAMFRSGRQADALSHYEMLRRALADELGIDPSPELRDLHVSMLRGELYPGGRAPAADGDRQILAGAAREPARPGTEGRPARWIGRGLSPGGIVGRESDQRALAESLGEYAAVTVTGMAGVGKTELALQAASRLAGDFADGLSVAELGTMPAQQTSDLHVISGMVLSALGAPPGPGLPGWEALLDWLRPQELLLVLDNAEHVALACSRLVDLITRTCPAVRVLTTSRRQLGFAGERVISLDPLAPPDAERLLLRRAAERGSDADLRADPAGRARLCEQLGGLPLALELAAAKLRAMSLTALTERISLQPGLLTVDSRPGLAHQRGLLTTLCWSYDLLSEPRQQLLQRLTVFAGTFSMADAERVCGESPLSEPEVAGLLSGLAEDSLVHVTDDHEYRLLVPVREFAATRAGPGQLDSTRAAHLHRFCAAAELIEDTTAADRQRIIAELEQSYHEIAAALEWALRDQATPGEAQRGVRLLLAGRPVWERRHGAILGARDAAERALPRMADLPPGLASRLLLLAGHLRFWTGSIEAARPLLEQVRERDAGDRAGHARRAFALTTLAAIACGRGEPGAARLIRESIGEVRKTEPSDEASFLLGSAAQMLAALGHLDEALEVIAEADLGLGGDPRLRLRYLVRRAFVCLRAGLLAEATADLDLVLADEPEISSVDLGMALIARGYVLTRQGDLEAARDTLAGGVRMAQQRAPVLLPDMNQALAVIEMAAGNPSRAARHVREVLEWALPNSAVMDAVGALHVAVVLAARLGSPRAGQLAASVRGIRAATGLPTWPLTMAEYSGQEDRLCTGESAPCGTVTTEMLTSTCALALSSITGWEQAEASTCGPTPPRGPVDSRDDNAGEGRRSIGAEDLGDEVQLLVRQVPVPDIAVRPGHYQSSV